MYPSYYTHPIHVSNITLSYYTHPIHLFNVTPSYYTPPIHLSKISPQRYTHLISHYCASSLIQHLNNKNIPSIQHVNVSFLNYTPPIHHFNAS